MCDDSSSEFGTLVRSYRHAVGLTQVELADKAGISVAALRDFEQSRRRRPRSGTLMALIAALGLDQGQAAVLARAASRYRPPDSAAGPSQAGYVRTLAAPESAQGLWLTVLGPLEAWRDGIPVPLGPPARRAILGLLLISPGMLVRRDTIIEMLWSQTPPRTAVGLVQAHVSRIRRLLDPCPRSRDGRQAANGAGVIASVGCAYRLGLCRGEVDLLVFRDLAARAAAAWTTGDEAAAAEYYDQAVRLWRDDPLVDIDVLYGHQGVAALRYELVDVVLRYAEAACAVGRHAKVLPRLRALVRADPLNESAHAHLMIALAGCGQRATAIRVYQSMRLRLHRELGLHPGAELDDAYQRVLRSDIGSICRSVRGRPG